MNLFSIFIKIVLPTLGGIVTIGSIIGLVISLLSYGKGKDFFNGFREIYLNIVTAAFVLKRKNVLSTKKSEEELMDFITKWKRIKCVRWGWKVRQSPLHKGSIAFNIINKQIERYIIEKSLKHTIDELRILLLFKPKAEKELPDSFNDYKNEFDIYFKSTKSIHNLNIEDVKKNYENYFTKKKTAKITIRDILEVTKQIENIPNQKYRKSLNKFVKYVRKLIKEFKIDLTSYITDKAKTNYRIVLFQYKAHLNPAKERIPKILQEKNFTKLSKLPTTWLKVIDNEEFKSNSIFETWLRNELSDLFKTDTIGGANFFAINFPLKDLIEKDTAFDSTDYYFNEAIQTQMEDNPDFCEKIINSDIDKKYLKLSPSVFLMEPYSFLNCVLERNYTKEQFNKLTKKNNLSIENSFDFNKAKKDELNKAFDLNPGEYKIIKEAVETLDLLTMDLIKLYSS